MPSAAGKHFVKAILPSPIHANHLRIPEEFVTRFGNELSMITHEKEATIAVPDGRIWSMGLEKCGDHVFFCNNWQEFAEHYSIGYGCYLVFKYEGNSKFSVVIFDATCAEISYPIFNKTGATNNGEPNYTLPCPHGKQVQNHTKRRKRISKFAASQRAKAASNEFNLKHPSFTSTFKSKRVYVPSEFASKYLKPKVPLKLRNSNNRQHWQVSCLLNYVGSLSLRMVTGFAKFAKDNDLSEGDTCVFELIKRKPVVLLQVTSFRADENAN